MTRGRCGVTPWSKHCRLSGLNEDNAGLTALVLIRDRIGYSDPRRILFFQIGHGWVSLQLKSIPLTE